MEGDQDEIPIVVSDIKTDGTYVIPMSHYIRDNLIADGGSVELALLHNWFGNENTPKNYTRIVMIPTELDMERVFNTGKLKRNKFTVGSPSEVNKVLRDVFNLTDGSISIKWDMELIPFHNKLHHPVHVRLDTTRTKIIGISTHPKRPDMEVTSVHRRVHLGKTIYFVYFRGLVLTSELRSKLM
jgi:hypothetical protein